MRLAPGPRGLEVFKTVLGRKRDPVQLIAELHQSFGEIVRIPVGDTTQFLIGNLDGIKHVLVDNHRNYTKGPAYELLASILGNGLVTSEGEHWKKQRKTIQPIFQKERLRIFSQVMSELASVEASELHALSGQSVDIFSRMMDLALRIVSRTVLGADVEGQERKVHHAFTTILNHIEKLSTSKLRFLELLPGGSRFRGLRKLASKLPNQERREFLRAIETLNALIYGVISRRKSELGRSNGSSTALDLVTMLLQAKDDSGAPAMSDTEIRDEVMTLFLAGHETTATALTWSFYLLAKHPQYHALVKTETEAVLQDRLPNLEDLPKLAMSQWVFEEAMRLYPPVWRMSRFAKSNDEVQGYPVPSGSIVVITPYLIHRDPQYWKSPEVFMPERFSPEVSLGRPRMAYLPFGAGPRACVGAMYGMTEAQMILSVICRKVFFELPPSHVLELEPRVMLRPKGGMPMRVVPV